MFTLGGLVSSLASRAVIHSYGVVGTLRLSALFVLVGSALLALANSVPQMSAARTLVGLGCGISTTTVPLVLATVAPAHIRRSVGLLNQLFIVAGVLLGQALSFPLGYRYLWRFVPAVSVAIAVLQLLGSLFIHVPEDEPAVSPEAEPLLAPATRPASLSFTDLIRSKEPRIQRAFYVVLVTQFCQQITGISAVMYFSTRIMTPVFPGNAKVVALAIVMWKLPITASPAVLIERIGAKPLLIIPTFVMALASLVLAIGINQSAGALAIAGIMVFVTAFSVGLGPVVWVVIGDIVPPHARAAASSIGLAVNWSTNFVIGVSFLPLQAWLSGGQPSGEGNVFYVFAVTCALAALWIKRAYASFEAIAE